MNEQDNPSDHEDTTQQQLDLVNKVSGKLTATIARLIRLQANGQDVDVSKLRTQADELYTQLLDFFPKASHDQALVTSTPFDLMAAYWQQQKERREMASTGFSSLNSVLSGGLERDRLVVLLGAPGSGKTTFTNQLADHVAHDRAVLYVTSEDLPMALLSKTLARRSTIDYTAVLRGFPMEEDRINAAIAEYGAQPQAHHIRYVDATQGISLQEIADQAHSHFEALKEQTKGDGVIVVDYLQRLARAEDMRMRAKSEGKQALGIDARQAATAYTEKLRALACDLHCTVICLSAMSRASGYSNTSSNLLSAAKESGDIEYTADVILAIGEQFGDDGPVVLPTPGAFAWCITVAKNRQGLNSATGARIELSWFPALQKFVQRDNSASEQEQDEPASASNGNGRYTRRRR